jgi:hypothetical protein
MLLRRLAGILTALLMLHLSFVASDVACATHMLAGHAEMSTGQATGLGSAHAAGMAATMANHGSQSRDQHHRPCETPSQANCCQALASCGSTFAASAARSSMPSLQRDVFPRSVIDIPLSELVGPDTPPPKA